MSSNSSNSNDKKEQVIYAKMGSKYYPILLSAMCVVLIISGICVTKGVTFGPIFGDFVIPTDGAFFLFPASYVICAMIAELYGPQASKTAVIMGFVAVFFAVICYQIVLWLPDAGDEFSIGRQAALTEIVAPVWQTTIGGLVAFVAGQALNVFVMWLGKKRNKEKCLWLRLISSIAFSQFVDSIVFCSIAASAIGFNTLSIWAYYTIFGFVWKSLVQILLLPISAWLIMWIKANEPSYVEALKEQQI